MYTGAGGRTQRAGDNAAGSDRILAGEKQKLVMCGIRKTVWRNDDCG